MCIRRNKNEIKTENNPPHQKHTTKFTAARPPRPTRDGARRNTSHAVAHTCTLPLQIPGLFVEISLACIHTYPHCCCCDACCIRFDAQFTRQRGFFCSLYCDICFRFRGCPVVLDIELSVSAWYQKTQRALYCCARSVFCFCFWQQTAEIGGVRCAA